jgi:hypothetical protein
MARTKALGGWLSKGKDRQRRVSGPNAQKLETVPSEILFWWKVRGCLWALSFSISIIGSLSGKRLASSPIFHAIDNNSQQPFVASIHFVLWASCSLFFPCWWQCHCSGRPGTSSMLPTGMPNCKVGTFECKANEPITCVVRFHPGFRCLTWPIARFSKYVRGQSGWSRRSSFPFVGFGHT